MKRKIAIATVTAAALIGTGTLSAAAVADDGEQQRSASTVQVQDRDDRDDRDGKDDDRDDKDDRDDRDDRDGKDDDRDNRDDDKREAASARVDASEAAAAALKSAPGTVTGIDLDEGRNGPVWEVDVTKKGSFHEVTLDAGSGKVLSDNKDGEESDDDTVPSGLKVSAAEAAEKAAGQGTVTSVDFGDDGDRNWEVEVTGKDGKETELAVDAQSGNVTQQKADDDAQDDRDDDRDDRDDDRDDKDDKHDEDGDED
ncbi:Peptidase propeptide and YPEB domain-containing protein [Streptomyces sp. WMMB 714]|uniref:PepSY domain-containing protein n=1 Tax=Streptomyces sp. WMMB 714 TaxID=1286822 RepID=UPI0005F78F10|nr:PepSY domain-containing protein [Streptomyces sp. WMMB 714]SCK35046.1 Peptidase propeptide and YPEB domain-containing protein [Streptomyces sp. WMMB 714]